MRDRYIESILLKKIIKNKHRNIKECCKRIKKLFNLKFKKLFFFGFFCFVLFLFLFFSIQNMENTSVCLHFEQAKINYVFFFLFKIFLEIFKDMTKIDRKSILLPGSKASC